MKSSQIGTKIKNIVAVAILSAVQAVSAAETPKVVQLPADFFGRIKQVYADKNRPFPQGSTKVKVSPSVPSTGTQKSSIKMGGVSDGGGNAVGATLFDFYENQGSLEISVEELVRLEPKTQSLLDYLNRQVPAIDYVESGGFGDILVNFLKFKKIYLESKGISSEACKNQSMVAASDQVVVACQSDTELRISVDWLLSTDANNRVGLFSHELVLAWARALYREDDKVLLEQKVRELNRQIFSSYASNKDVSQSIQDVFGAAAYNPKRYRYLKVLPEKVFQATASFCTNPNVDSSVEFAAYRNDALLRVHLPEVLVKMLNISAAARTGQKMDAKSEVVWREICNDYHVDIAPVREPIMGALSSECIDYLDKSIYHISRYSSEKIEGVTDGEMQALIAGAISELKMSALYCSGARGIALEKRPKMTEAKGRSLMNETYVESLIYARWKLAKIGLKISFMGDSLKK